MPRVLAFTGSLFLLACGSGGRLTDSATGVTGASGGTTGTTGDQVPTTSDSTTGPAMPTTLTTDPDPGDAPPPLGRVEIGMWCGLPADQLTDARFAEIAAAGFTVVTNACDVPSQSADYNHTMLALAEAHDLKARVADNRLSAAASGTDVSGNLDAVVQDFAASPALLAYHLRDEPAANQFPLIAAAVAGLRERDPDHPGIANLLPDYASAAQLGAPSYGEYVDAFLAQVEPDVFTYEHYPFLGDGTDSSSFFANLAAVRDRSLMAGVPFGLYIQSTSYNGRRAPTGPEKRWAALHALAYGATAIHYFTYWTASPGALGFGNGIIDGAGVPTAQYAEVTEINRTVTAIGRYLGPATSSAVYHNGSLAAGTAPRQPGAAVYVPSNAPVTVGMFSSVDDAFGLVVSRDHANPVETDIYLAASKMPSMLDPLTGELTPVQLVGSDEQGYRVHVALAPGDAALFYQPGPLPPGSPGAEGYLGLVRADAGMLHVVDDTFDASPIQAAGWDQCLPGTINIGTSFHSNGFWLCAREDLADHVFHVGNVVADSATVLRLEKGTVTDAGAAGWDTCPSGLLVAHAMHSNGFWVCMDP